MDFRRFQRFGRSRRFRALLRDLGGGHVFQRFPNDPGSSPRFAGLVQVWLLPVFRAVPRFRALWCVNEEERATSGKLGETCLADQGSPSVKISGNPGDRTGSHEPPRPVRL